MRDLSLLSVVAPLHNEEEGLPEFHRRVTEALSGAPFELILVDDGSTDGTADSLDRLASEDERVRVIHLSRNFGHQSALTAGLDHARGDAVAMIDADLQDPPELIPEMVERWRQGSDVVYGVRREREGETWFKRASARWFYRLFSELTDGSLAENAGDFRLMDRGALDALLEMRERSRFLRGMAVWVGFTQTAIPYDREPREAGETKFTLRRMLRFSMDAITSFSHAPLQFATLMGFGFAALAFVGLPVAIVFRATDQFVPGITTTIFVVLALGGIQLITVGMIGEYVARIYDEVKGRPLYVVREVRNLPRPLVRERPAPDREAPAGEAEAAGATGRDPEP